MAGGADATTTAAGRSTLSWSWNPWPTTSTTCPGSKSFVGCWLTASWTLGSNAVPGPTSIRVTPYRRRVSSIWLAVAATPAASGPASPAALAAASARSRLSSGVNRSLTSPSAAYFLNVSASRTIRFRAFS